MKARTRGRFVAALSAAILQPNAMPAASAHETVKPVFATQLLNVLGSGPLAVFVAEDNAKFTTPGAQ